MVQYLTRMKHGRAMAVAASFMVVMAGSLAQPVHAGVLDAAPIKGVLGKASDSALDKLAKPGAFYADTAIRILLPGMGGKTTSKLMGFGDKLGVTDKLTKSLNDAAGLAAQEAKPVFRKAVDGLTLADAPGIALEKDGATQYLRKSAGDELRGKLRPLIVTALTQVRAYKQIDKLGKAGALLGMAGLSRDGLTDSVTDQTMSGIFKYIANEEASLRANPLGVGKSLLNGIIK